jgi:hypothetical protein
MVAAQLNEEPTMRHEPALSEIELAVRWGMSIKTLQSCSTEFVAIRQHCYRYQVVVFNKWTGRGA